MEFLNWINGKWDEILRVPVIAGIGYGIDSYYRDDFNWYIFLGFTVGITVLQTLIIFVIWHLLKLRKAKNERAYSESH